MGSGKVRPNGGNFFRLYKTDEDHSQTSFPGKNGEIHSDLPVWETTHQHPTGSNESQTRRRVSQGNQNVSTMATTIKLIGPNNNTTIVPPSLIETD